ncbi:hypothetical protein B0H14DRAFT_2699339 [Mycena olivaceomarginata]|nr:hypothetical protein B0H14DRAFT_2699339 [Mycena olivaceomarginata]
MPQEQPLKSGRATTRSFGVNGQLQSTRSSDRHVLSPDSSTADVNLTTYSPRVLGAGIVMTFEKLDSPTPFDPTTVLADTAALLAFFTSDDLEYVRYAREVLENVAEDHTIENEIGSSSTRADGIASLGLVFEGVDDTTCGVMPLSTDAWGVQMFLRTRVSPGYVEYLVAVLGRVIERLSDDDDEMRCRCSCAEDGLSIACDVCGRWCHAACFGISKRNLPQQWACWLCSMFVPS